MPGWESLRKMVEVEFQQSTEEGRDIAALQNLHLTYEDAGDDAGKLRAVWKKILEVSISPDFAFDEPSDLETIRTRRSNGPRRIVLKLSEDELFNRIYGAWLGRCAGCALGKPVEGFMNEKNGLSSRQRKSTTIRGANNGARL